MSNRRPQPNMFRMSSHDHGTEADGASFNYSVLKVLSILMVLTGHWFSTSRLPLWIPTTIGLFIFSFSSGLFTTRIYGPDLDVEAFWRKKLQRLLVRYWFLLACLTLLLVVRNEPVFHWHSLVHFLGLSGFLNVFGHNQSALGAGLWFFSLLLLFYIAYPGIVRMFARSGNQLLLPLIVTLVFVAIDCQVNLGFSLWLTTLGFMLGVFAGLYGTQVPPRLSLVSAIVLLAVMLGLNAVLNFKAANSALLALICIATNLYLLRARIPQWAPLRALSRLENCLLEIFIIHAYLFVHPSGNTMTDFCVSLALIIGAAWMLNLSATQLMASLFNPRARKATRSTVMADPLAAELGLHETIEH